ncbi:MAG: hypothetical protein P1U32_02140 [Legionellaceae bacterium]|nr:hypothetical protein [Legionellaceae bacterium]
MRAFHSSGDYQVGELTAEEQAILSEYVVRLKASEACKIEFQTAVRDDRVKVATFLQDNKDAVQMLIQQTAKHPVSQHPIKMGRYDVTETLSDLHKALSEQAPFKAVSEACEAVLTILKDDESTAEQIEEKLKGFIQDMGATDLYKSWSECKDISQSAHYMLHKIEAAIRCILTFIRICSSTPEAQITRENFFMKGPNYAIFDNFNTYINDLKTAQDNLVSLDETRKAFEVA